MRLRQAALHPFLVARSLDRQAGNAGLTSADNAREIAERLKQQLEAAAASGTGAVQQAQSGEVCQCCQSSEGGLLLESPCGHELILCGSCRDAAPHGENQLSCAQCGTSFAREDAVGIEADDGEGAESGSSSGQCRWMRSTKLACLLESIEEAWPSLPTPGHSEFRPGQLEVRTDHPDEKCLVFCSFTGFLDLVEEHLERSGSFLRRLDGTMSKEERDSNIQEFAERRGHAVFLLSTKVGGVGLNLTSASRVFLCDPGWNPFIEAQASSRAHRMGQTRRVVVKRFLVRGSVEQQVRKLQEKKFELASTFLEGKFQQGGQAQVQATNLSHDDLKRLFEAQHEPQAH
jgi:SNF2 family DNA or RNA helicase